MCFQTASTQICSVTDSNEKQKKPRLSWTTKTELWLNAKAAIVPSEGKLNVVAALKTTESFSCHHWQKENGTQWLCGGCIRLVLFSLKSIDRL